MPRFNWPWEEGNPEGLSQPPLAEPEISEKVRYGNQWLGPNHPYVKGRSSENGSLCINFSPLWPSIKGLMTKPAKTDFHRFGYDNRHDDLVIRGGSDAATGFLEIRVIPTSPRFDNAEGVADWPGIHEDTREQLYRAILEVVHARVFNLKEGENFEGVKGSCNGVEYPIIGLRDYQNMMQERHIQVSNEEDKAMAERVAFKEMMQAKRAAKIAMREEERRAAAEAQALQVASLQSTTYGFIYLIRNKDLCKIGITENLKRRMDQLKPDEILNVVRCSNYQSLERELHSQYKNVRIPQTEYFRLSELQIQQVHKLMTSLAEF